jgi:hypothetical protein
MRQRAGHALAGIVPRSETISGVEWQQHSLSYDQFPVPELILYGLRNLGGLQSYGPQEKLRWAISGSCGHLPFLICLEKSGLRLYLPRGSSDQMLHDLLGRFRTAANLAETCLRYLAELQIEAGNVTIENQYRSFRGAYEFFRSKAGAAYEAKPTHAVVTRRDSTGRVRGLSHRPWQHQIEGGYLAGAMVDAYFSLLEHVLVLVLPFLDFDPRSGALKRFVGLTWDQKWREVFDVGGNLEAKRVWEQLRHIKETVRNPLSHGGFGKNGTSFFFHVDTNGALPALLTRHGRSFELFMTRVPRQRYQELCRELDEVDEFLEKSRIGAGIQYARASLDISFGADFRRECRLASESPEALKRLIERQAHLSDMHANMDY